MWEKKKNYPIYWCGLWTVDKGENVVGGRCLSPLMLPSQNTVTGWLINNRFLLLTSVSARCVEALCLKTSWDLLLWPVFRHLPRTLIPATIGTARLADRAKGFAERRAASAEPKRPRTFWAWFLWCLYHLNNWEMEPLVPEQKHKLCLSSQVWTLPGLLLFFYLFTDFLQCKSFWKVPRDTCSVGTVFTLSFRNKCQELACLHNLTISPPHCG